MQGAFGKLSWNFFYIKFLPNKKVINEKFENVANNIP